ncbi:hypothetical protein HYV22_03335 [Candidatus Gottesmanbacteria bacterium]|nr:hypothetical protein [Candidatus Gottesmanbacteria bacterium]
MNRVIVQVPMTSELRKKAEDAAQAQGFSSLQDAIRMFLANLANRQLIFGFTEPDEYLSPKAERRYAKRIEEIKKGKHVTKTSSLEELFKYLNS